MAKMNGSGSRAQMPKSNTTRYSGQVKLTQPEGEVSVITTNLTGIINLGSDGTGLTSVIYTTDQVTSLPEWSTWVALYREYRVLGMEVTYRPRATPAYPAGSIQIGYGANFIQHGTSSAPSQVVYAVENATFQAWDVGTNARRVWKMSSVDESNFIPMGSSANFGGVGFVNEFAQASSAFGTVYLRYLVQFRGRS